MSCERYADALLETALGEPAAPELVGHLRSCAACREALERERGLVARLDGELRDAVSVTPSPELLPRVRARVADAATTRRPWRLFWLVPVAAGLIALVTAVSLRRPAEPQRIQARSAPVPAVAESPRPIPEAPVSVPAPPDRARVRRPRLERVMTDAEVLVPPGEAELIRRFAVALQTRRVDAAAVLAGERQSASPDLAIPVLEEIAPLDVKPLMASPDPEGVNR